MPAPSVPRDAWSDSQASASRGAGKGPAASARRGASVWRPKIRDEVPEDEMRRRFLTITEEEKSQFSDLPVVRMPCCVSVHPAGWRQCMFCGALFQYMENIIPSAPGSVNSMAGDAVAARAATAAKVVHVGKLFHIRSAKGDFWQHIAEARRWRSRWRRMTPRQRIARALARVCCSRCARA